MGLSEIRSIRGAKETCTGAAHSAKPLTMTPKVFFRSVAWLFVTLAPVQFRPVTAAPVSLERFAAFVAIGAAFCLGYPKHRLHILVLLIGIVGFLEVIQNYVPSRHGRLPDGLVKASGVLLGAACAVFITRYGSLLRETRREDEL
jgi:hypothetical protein